MSELRERLLTACTRQSRGVTGETDPTDGGNTSRYACYARYAPNPHSPQEDGANNGQHSPSLGDNREWDASEWEAFFDERAAIREHDGGFTKSEAERLAFAGRGRILAHLAPARTSRASIHAKLVL